MCRWRPGWYPVGPPARSPVMPFRSRAQFRKFAAMRARGEISEETFRRWVEETGRRRLRKLPERAKKRG